MEVLTKKMTYAEYSALDGKRVLEQQITADQKADSGWIGPPVGCPPESIP